MNQLLALIQVRSENPQTVRSLFASMLVAWLLSNACAFAGALHDAAETGNLEEIRRLLAMGVPVSARGKSLNDIEETPLNAAAYSVHPEVVRLLLEHGADVEGKGYQERTPLADVADGEWETKVPEADRVEVAKLLLARGARVDARNQNGRTPLMEAARNGFPLLVALFLEHKADPNAKDKEKVTPLSEVLSPDYWSGREMTEAECTMIVKLLLNNGAKAKEQDGWSPLIAAVDSQMGVETIRLLLDKGAKANYQSPIKTEYFLGVEGDKVGGGTALSAAVDHKNPDLPTVRLLLERGAQVNTSDTAGWTPLHYAAANCENPDVLNMLLAAGADLNARNKDGETPLAIAVRLDNPTAVRVLRARGAR